MFLSQNFDDDDWPRPPSGRLPDLPCEDRLKSIPGLNITGITHQASQHNIKCKSADFIFYSDIIDKIFTATFGEFIYESIGRNIHLLKSKFKLIDGIIIDNLAV